MRLSQRQITLQWTDRQTDRHRVTIHQQYENSVWCKINQNTKSRDMRSFEIRFEFESDDSDSILKWHLPSYHKPRSLFNKKNFNRCTVVIEIYFMFMIFIARQHPAANARYWYTNSVRPSVRLSVRDTLVLYENGSTYRHSFFSIR